MEGVKRQRHIDDLYYGRRTRDTILRMYIIEYLRITTGFPSTLIRVNLSNKTGFSMSITHSLRIVFPSERLVFGNVYDRPEKGGVPYGKTETETYRFRVSKTSDKYIFKKGSRKDNHQRERDW